MNARKFKQVNEIQTQLRKVMTKSQEFAQAKGSGTKVTIPSHLKEFVKVFNKKAAERLPPSRKWDHAIDLKEGFVPRDCQVYTLSP